jgi:hypothetical protein
MAEPGISGGASLEGFTTSDIAREQEDAEDRRGKQVP